MGTFTKLTTQCADEILALYGLGPLKLLKPLGLGISNSNYKAILEDESVLLKVSDDKGEAELRGEQEILSYLKQRGYPYSICPLSLKGQDETIYHYKGNVGVIFEFVPGIPPGPSDETCYEIGRALALLHKIEKNEGYFKLRPHEEVGFGAPAVVQYTKKDTCPEDFKKAFSRIFSDGLNHYRSMDFEQGLIHGDLYYDNTLFHNNHLNCVLDFEQAGRGPLILDLGICISGTCLEKGTINLKLINSLLEGYEQIRPLPEQEKQMLNQSILLALFSIALWRIKRFKEGDLDPSKEDNYRELLQRAINFYNLLDFASTNR
jgi:homoserine kinase type II